jgi:hypothetical protein
MSTTPQSTPGARAVPRCQHIKTNGVQCGSPALRTERYCFFHHQHRRRAHEFDLYEPVKSALNLPALEDANSIQVVLTEVLRRILTRHIDHDSATLILRVLRLAATNVKFTSFDPIQKTQIVIDPESVENRPLGATAWSETEGQDYDQIAETEAVPAPRQTKTAAPNRSNQRNSNRSIFTTEEHEMPKDKMDEKSRACLNDLLRLTIGQKIDPDYLDRPYSPKDAASVNDAIDAIDTPNP